MNDNAAIVFNGFLQLPNLEKLTIVEAINEYFDSNEREPMRAAVEARFAEIDRNAPDFRCVCCGR